MGNRSRKWSARVSESSDEVKRVEGCAIPLLKGGCCVGSPPSEGLPMVCTSEKCEFKDQPVHACCLEALEDVLVKELEHKGAARNWTPTQRRHNIWNHRGLPLIQKHCRCPCKHGLRRLDVDAMEAEQLRVKNALVVAEGSHHNYKKKKASKLPTIVTTPAFEVPEHQMDVRLHRLDTFAEPGEYTERYRAPSASRRKIVSFTHVEDPRPRKSGALGRLNTWNGEYFDRFPYFYPDRE
ncbi:hypothetical protein L596_028617 [Steinernema carpocapsae]|uniref:Headcase N-terminal domain-containing protein n=1 Tax=Steinernema carpocapsae TaxID=34508 RepID=A0A4U5LYX6_STECR|nr:hypothetical protein L596_028617 [Steinernema carpocapsae]